MHLYSMTIIIVLFDKHQIKSFLKGYKLQKMQLLG